MWVFGSVVMFGVFWGFCELWVLAFVALRVGEVCFSESDLL